MKPIIKIEIFYNSLTGTYCAEIYIRGNWHKEIGGVSDPALLLNVIERDEELAPYMRPDLKREKESL